MADLTLYNLSEEFDYICELLDRDILEPEEEEKLKLLFGQKLQNSADEIMKFFKNNEASIKALKEEASFLTKKASKIKEQEDKIRAMLQENMKKLGLKNISSPIGKLTLSNTETLSVDVVDLDSIPEQFVKTEVKKSVDKVLVKKHYEKTKEIPEGVQITKKVGSLQFRK